MLAFEMANLLRDSNTGSSAHYTCLEPRQHYGFMHAAEPKALKPNISEIHNPAQARLQERAKRPGKKAILEVRRRLVKRLPRSRGGWVGGLGLISL